MYQAVFVWKRLSKRSAVRYSCLLDVSNGMVAVQSADFFQTPVASSAVEFFDRQFVELLTEIDPQERCAWYSSVIDAIQAHDSEFAEVSEPGTENN